VGSRGIAGWILCSILAIYYIIHTLFRCASLSLSRRKLSAALFFCCCQNPHPRRRSAELYSLTRTPHTNKVTTSARTHTPTHAHNITSYDNNNIYTLGAGWRVSVWWWGGKKVGRVWWGVGYIGTPQEDRDHAPYSSRQENPSVTTLVVV